jgi:hypothetical protein
MSFRNRNPYMTINHGLIGAKKGHGDNRFLLIYTFSEYAHLETNYFPFNTYDELMDSGKYNWFHLLFEWVSAVDQESIIEEASGVVATNRLGIKDWDINFQKTLGIKREYDRENRKYKVVSKQEYTPQEVKKIFTKDRKYSLPLYNKQEIKDSLDSGCETPKIIMDMINFDLKKWLENPKTPENLQSYYVQNELSNIMHLRNLVVSDLNSADFAAKRHGPKDVFKIDDPIYEGIEIYEDAYSDIRAHITNNEILLKTGTSYDETYAYSISIKKL